ncbi:IS1 family transposase [Shigella sp. FC6548]|nr:IS1 family transposase [Shigella sp. FC6548]
MASISIRCPSCSATEGALNGHWSDGNAANLLI